MNMLNNMIVISVVMACYGGSLSMAQGSSDDLFIHEADRIQAAPEINGRLDDNCWQKARWWSGFQAGPNKPAAVQTSFAALYDDQYFYLGIKCDEPDVAGLVMRHTERDSEVYEDDCVEVFIDPAHSHQSYYQFILNPKGAKYDGHGMDAGWNPEWDVKTSVTNGSWTIEMRVPFSAFNQAPQDKKASGAPVFGVAICRNRRNAANPELSYFGAVYGSHHQPERFGHLFLDRKSLVQECLAEKEKVAAAFSKNPKLAQERKQIFEENNRKVDQLAKNISSADLKACYREYEAIVRQYAELLAESERSGDYYAFDFGTSNSPMFPGFTAASENTLYNRGLGYGWVPQKGGKALKESEYGPKQKIAGLRSRDVVDKGSVSLFGSLYRDNCSSGTNQVFAVDVTNGRYRVVTFHADYAYGKEGEQTWGIEAEGKRVVDKVVFPGHARLDIDERPAELLRKRYAERTTETTFETDVTDGQLNLMFDSKPQAGRDGFILNGLVVLPVNNSSQIESADRAIKVIHAAIERDWGEAFAKGFAEKPRGGDEHMPPVSDADKARGYVAFVPHWMTTNIYPNSVPRPADMKRPLGCFACPGEYEPMLVALRALRPLKEAKCAVSDLKGPGVIPASAIDVRVARCWPQRFGSSWATEWRVVPELLEAKESVDVAADKTQGFWLTILVPAEAKPGVYNGTVTIRASGADETSIPVAVEVLPFTLQPIERSIGMYWKEVKDNDKLRDAQVRDMLAHGMTTIAMGGIQPIVRNDGDKLALDAEELHRYLCELKKLGIKGPIPYHISPSGAIKRAFPTASPERLDELYVEVIRKMEAIMTPADTPKLLYYPVDEIGNSPERGKKAQHECALIAKVPGATSYITVNNYEAGEKWGDTFDIWCGNVVYTAEQEKKLLARGKRYMRYGGPNQNNARRARSNSGLGFYRRPAEAMFYWHYQACNGDPFNDFDGSARDWCFSYPGPNGELISTIDWEGMREGVDDMRYIATLKYYVALAAKTPEGKPAADRALAALDEVMGGEDNLNQSEFRTDLGDDDYHALRRKLVDAIIALREVCHD